MEETLLQNTTYVPYEYEDERQELTKVLKQAREINEIQAELASIIDIQDEDLQHIDTSTTEAVDLAVNANLHLESASGKKFKFTPLMI